MSSVGIIRILALNMIILADSGSTKCDWVVLDQNKKVVFRTSTLGINPRLLSKVEISKILKSAEPLFGIREQIKKILFYGAGCSMEQSKLKLQSVLKKYFHNAEVKIEEDITAAVHGVTKLPGVVCILGTGSNCCYFDGVNIQVYQSSLGYSVMDEGSGNYFGKQLLRAYFYNQMPNKLKKIFEENFDVSLDSVLKNLYESENPSAYLASFAKFVIHHRSQPFIETIIYNGIKELFDNLIGCYEKELKINPLHFVGSIGYYLRDEIKLEAKNRHFKIGSFVKKPIDNLIGNINITRA